MYTVCFKDEKHTCGGMYSRCDRTRQTHGLETIKTIGLGPSKEPISSQKMLTRRGTKRIPQTFGGLKELVRGTTRTTTGDIAIFVSVAFDAIRGTNHPSFRTRGKKAEVETQRRTIEIGTCLCQGTVRATAGTVIG